MSPEMTRGLSDSGLPFAFALVSLLPIAFMTLTSFVKISTVLQIVRGAVGAVEVPSGAVVMVLSLSLTLLAMAPTGRAVWDRVSPIVERTWLAPHSSERRDAPSDRTLTSVIEIVQAAADPVKQFLSAHASTRDRKRFADVAKKGDPAHADAISTESWTVLVPAFVVTQLYEAFALGFALYLPFLVVDLLVTQLLIALGMQALSPMQISLPVKLLLFVAVDGWGLLARSLAGG